MDRAFRHADGAREGAARAHDRAFLRHMGGPLTLCASDPYHRCAKVSVAASARLTAANALPRPRVIPRFPYRFGDRPLGTRFDPSHAASPRPAKGFPGFPGGVGIPYRPRPMTGLALERDAVLRRACELGASDVLVTAGHPILVTIAGVLQPLPGSPVLGGIESRRLAESFLTPALHEKFLRDLELDTRYELAGVANFRLNLFIQRGQWGTAIRIVPLTIPLPGELGIAPHVVSHLLGVTRGLILITGPTGAGKSTTIASLLEQVNQHGPRKHIVTVEDPIEFVFAPRHAVFDQREVGVDTKSYARGLKGALRQLPHIIFVGEMRDLTSMAIALSAAETGNLVISTMATQSAAQTVTRIIDSFPPHQQPQIRAQLALTLRAVVSQLLLPRADGRGRVAAREIMFVNQAISNLIREDKIHQIPNVIATSLREDMVALDESLTELVERGVITFDTAYPYFEDVEKRALLQKRFYRIAPLAEARGTR
jgi:twitching motility protein PilT